MTRASALSLWAMPALAVLALGLALPAFGAAPAPTISGYAATNPRGVAIFSAPPGAPLLILGQNLGTSGSVAFGGIPAPPPASWSPTEILVTVPTGPSYPFKGPVTVTTNGQTASGPEFTITPPPTPAPPPPPPPPTPRPGDLDPGFGSGGKVLTDFGGDGAVARAVALQPDGRIVVAGYSWVPGKYNFALASYNANGSLDSSFGTGGKVLTEIGDGGAGVSGVAVQPDGRIIVAGWSAANGTADFALARYTANGSPDPSFGTGGKVLTDFGGDGAGASAVAVQSDGQIVVAGWSYSPNGGQDFALARYNANGSLDTSFGTSGKVLTDFGGRGAEASSVAAQPDGRIVVAGGFALARYNANGSLDASFGTGGKVLTDFGGSDLAVQPDGQIVVAGEFALMRYNGSGSLDPSFGSGGKVLAHFGARAVAVQPEGQIIVAGGKAGVVLARYTGNGSLDASFGTGGEVLTDYLGGSDLAVQPDGQIVVAGSSNVKDKVYFALARYQGR